MQTSDEEARLLAMPEDAYMNEEQLAFFRQRLLDEQADIEDSLHETRRMMAIGEWGGDELDKAACEEELRLSLRQADRQTRLLRNIAAALKRIDAGDYGYCENTGMPIGLPRLLLRPTARLCLEEKERQEQREYHYRKRRSGGES